MYECSIGGMPPSPSEALFILTPIMPNIIYIRLCTNCKKSCGRKSPPNLSSLAFEIQLKGCMEERPLDFLPKSKMAKTAPNFACQFVYTCRKLPCTHFPLFQLRSPEIKYAKTVAWLSLCLLELLCYTILLALFFF